MKKDARPKKPRATAKEKPVRKAPPVPRRSVLARLLGGLTGVGLTLLLLLALYAWTLQNGLLAPPAALGEAPAGLEVRGAVPAATVENASVKLKAFRLAREEKLRSTLSLTEEEVYALLRAKGSPVDRIRIEPGRMLLSAPSRVVGVACRLTGAVIPAAGGLAAGIVDAAWVGRFSLPAWIGLAEFAAPARAGFATLLSAFGADRVEAKLADGELILTTM